MVAITRAADLFVLSSVREANPVALLEAMSCGLPCIASRLDGSTDVIIEDGVNGRSVIGDAACADAIDRATNDHVLAREEGMLCGISCGGSTADRRIRRSAATSWT